MTTTRVLAALAVVLGALAAVVGRPVPSVAGRIDVDALAREIMLEQDHVTAVELAQWLRAHKSGLRLVDVRDSADFATYHIPSAENVPIDRIGREHFDASETIVLYSDGGAHAAQAWVLLRSLGLGHVYLLRGGVGEWLDDVINPTLAPDATDADKEAFKSVTDLSQYFGGTPHVGDKPSAVATADKIAAMKRRGC